jgi:hypothetical protein
MSRQPRSEITQAVQRGLDSHRQGRLAEAERNYAWVLARQSDQFDALGLDSVQHGHRFSRRRGFVQERRDRESIPGDRTHRLMAFNRPSSGGARQSRQDDCGSSR